MLPTKEFLDRAIEATLDLNVDEACEIAYEALELGIDTQYLLEHGFHAALSLMKGLFDEGRIYLPHMIVAAEAVEAATTVLMPASKKNSLIKSKGIVLLGTIEGDIHSIGKDIVATSLQIDGYEVIDLGVDVPIETFVEEAIKVHPDVIATSALMTITMTNQLTLEESLKEAGIRDKLKTMVGGTPVTSEWAKEIGADIYGDNASDAVRKVNSLMWPEKEEALAINKKNCSENVCY
ncbi:methyltransferase cognate corrinoid protein [Methanolobus sediminis]|uniref:Methyltransferase cognate corrinoid protein n=1 Tax=Methanolobus sediminis TaxID=3072978 RepID=A0AA51UJE3_9EURY|nr:methyltransferase cognate corrinoid protein [Methanolobus sediminis]WMW24637.1 methyltransferase cognate corrinoid protein [Methanolobus sediminis]